MTDQTPEHFGFVVERETRWSYTTDQDTVVPDSWIVKLPHHCCPWDDIADGIPHAEAVARFERFIAEAQAALEALKAEREMGVEQP